MTEQLENDVSGWRGGTFVLLIQIITEFRWPKKNAENNKNTEQTVGNVKTDGLSHADWGHTHTHTSNSPLIGVAVDFLLQLITLTLCCSSGSLSTSQIFTHLHQFSFQALQLSFCLLCCSSQFVSRCSCFLCISGRILGLYLVMRNKI